MRAARIRSLKDLVQDEHNANRGTKRGATMLQTSLKRYGAGRSVLVDRRGRIIAGNKTVASATEAGLSGVVVVPTKGDKLVIVQRTDLDLGTRAARELAIADNRVGEVNLDWDPEGLKFPDVDLSDFWNEAELRSLGLNGNGSEAPEPQLDRGAELQKKWKTARGQIWEIEKHRLMCGDSTSVDDCDALFASRRATLLLTDPPYGVDYSGLVKSRKNQKRGGWSEIKGDELSDEALTALLSKSLEGRGSVVAFVWHPAGAKRFCFWKALIQNGWKPAQEIVWVKNSFVFGRADYQWRHEPCIYAKRNGASRQADRTQSTVWEINKPMDSQHPTQKPVELFKIPIANHTEKAEIVFDPYLGSGTAMIAAQQLGRSCCGMEIEPKYVAVALERLSEIGLKPKLLHEKVHRPN